MQQNIWIIELMKITFANRSSWSDMFVRYVFVRVCGVLRMFARLFFKCCICFIFRTKLSMPKDFIKLQVFQKDTTTCSQACCSIWFILSLKQQNVLARREGIVSKQLFTFPSKLFCVNFFKRALE